MRAHFITRTPDLRTPEQKAADARYAEFKMDSLYVVRDPRGQIIGGADTHDAADALADRWERRNDGTCTVERR